MMYAALDRKWRTSVLQGQRSHFAHRYCTACCWLQVRCNDFILSLFYYHKRVLSSTRLFCFLITIVDLRRLMATASASESMSNSLGKMN